LTLIIANDLLTIVAADAIAMTLDGEFWQARAMKRWVVVGACLAGCSKSDPKLPTSAPPTSVAVAGATAESPAIRLMNEWFKAFNADDFKAVHAFSVAHMPGKPDVADEGFRKMTGGFVIKRVKDLSPTSAEAIVKEQKSEQYARAQLELDPKDPNHVVSFDILAGATPDEFLSPDERKSRLVDDALRRALLDGTPAARQFAAWLTTFNSGDRGALVAYHQQNFPYEVASEDVAGIDHEFGLSQGTGGFDVKKPENPTSTSIVAILKERRSDQFARAKMEVDAAEPHRVVRFEIHPIPTPDEFLTPAQRKERSIDGPKRAAVIDKIAAALAKTYVDADKAKSMATALRAHLAKGDYDKIVDGPAFAMRLTDDLHADTHDMHMRVMFGPHPKDEPPPPPEADQLAQLRQMNYGFGPIERMHGNVAHLQIDGFPAATFEAAQTGIGELMSQAADADALIIDLRNNGGGSPETVALVASYVFDDKPVHLVDIYERETKKTTQSWTQSKLHGKRFGGKKPVYVITSKRTFSGGEEFAYDLQTTKRAKIIGETTGGGAHPTKMVSLDDWFALAVPFAESISPITHRNWEGTGVVPDVLTSADAALDEALKRALADLKHR
jgi:hypothetical protein